MSLPLQLKISQCFAARRTAYEYLTNGTSLEDQAVRQCFPSGKWQSVNPKELRSNPDSVFFLTDDAFLHFLPILMIASLESTIDERLPDALADRLLVFVEENSVQSLNLGNGQRTVVLEFLQWYSSRNHAIFGPKVETLHQELAAIGSVGPDCLQERT